MRSNRTSGSEDSKTPSEASNDPVHAGTHPALIESSGKDLASRPSSQPPQKRARHTLPAREQIATASRLHLAQHAPPTASPRFLGWLDTKWESGFSQWLKTFWKSGFLEWLETQWINEPGFFEFLETRWIEWQAQLGDQTLKLAKGSSSRAAFCDFTERASRRHKHKHKHYKERASVLRKPYQVNVLASGEIDGGCPGKKAWNTMVRYWVPQLLDLSVMEWEGQKSKAVRQVRRELDREFEYLGYSVSGEGFKNMIMRFMKTRVYQLKRRYNGGKKDCPVNVQANQWERLKKRWDIENQWKNPNKMARVGMEKQAALSKRITALENRCLELDEKLSQILHIAEATRVALLDIQIHVCYFPWGTHRSERGHC